MYKIICFFLFLCSLQATITTPFEMSLSTGYRQDHLKWRLQDPGDASTTIYRETYSHIKFLQSELALQKISRNIYLYANGGYGAFGKGSLDQGGFQLGFTSISPSFSFDTSGKTYNSSILLGYIAELTPDRFYEFNITPLFGFSIDYQKLIRKNPHPNSFVSDGFVVSSTLDGKDLRQKWWGVFIGFDIYAHPRGIICIKTGYRYHWLSMHQNFFSDIQVQKFDTNQALTLNQITKMHGTVRKSGNLGHSGYLQLCLEPLQKMSIYALGKVYYFSSKVLNMDVSNQVIELFPNPANIAVTSNQKFKSRWFVYEILFGLSFYL